MSDGTVSDPAVPRIERPDFLLHLARLFARVRCTERELDLFGAAATARLAVAFCAPSDTRIVNVYDGTRQGEDFHGRVVLSPDRLAEGPRERPVVIASSRLPADLESIAALIAARGRKPRFLHEVFQVEEPVFSSVLELLPPDMKKHLIARFPGRIWDEAGTHFYDRGQYPADPVLRAEFVARDEAFVGLYADTVASLGVSSALEIGCGMGRHLRRLRTCPGLSRVAGIDPSMKMLKRSGETLVGCADAVRLPFPDRSFDLVFTAGGVLQHLPHEKQLPALREMIRVARRHILLWESGIPSGREAEGYKFHRDWAALAQSTGLSCRRVPVSPEAHPMPETPEQFYFLRIDLGGS